MMHINETISYGPIYRGHCMDYPHRDWVRVTTSYPIAIRGLLSGGVLTACLVGYDVLAFVG